MLKDLQEQIKQEIDRMQNKLVAVVKELLKEESVLANISEDLNAIDVIIRKNKEEENKFYQHEYAFIFGVNEKGEINKGISVTGSVLLLQGGRVIGTYALPSVVDLKIMENVFTAIENFRAEELEAQKVTEAAPAE